MNDRGIITSYLLSPLSKNTKPVNTRQLELVKSLQSNRANVSLINKTVPVTLYNILLIFRDTDNKFRISIDLLKMMTKKTILLTQLNYLTKNYCFFAEERSFGEKALDKKY